MEGNLGESLLHYVNSNGSLESMSFAAEKNVDHQAVVGAIKSLQASNDIINVTQSTEKFWELTEEGKEIEKNGSYEFLLFRKVSGNEEILQSDLIKTSHDKIGFSKAMSNKWIRVDKKGERGPRVMCNDVCPEDTVKQNLTSVLNGGEVSDKDRVELKKRKLIQEVTVKKYHVTKGKNFTTNIEKPETDLTVQMMHDGSWKTKTFKEYNYSALGVPPLPGHLHPLLKARSVYRQIFLEMGFTEMPTNNYIESSFWNFDALFQPQQHPARDAHDTFFISDPAVCSNVPQDYAERVKKVHSVGGYGSVGYR